MSEQDLTILAQIGRAHGVHGAVRALSFTEPPEALLDYDRFHLVGAETPRILEVTNSKAQAGGHFIFKFKQVTTRAAAESLSGFSLGVGREQLPPPAEGEYYWRDLLGLMVQDKTFGEIGRVRRIFEAGAGPLLEILTGDGAKEILAPFNDHTLITVDLEAGLIQLDLPPGLLEL